MPRNHTSSEPPGRRLVLHIGAPKTGSTALQKFLHDNRQSLRGDGWLYPEISLRGFGHHDLAFMIAGGYPSWAKPEDVTLPLLQKQLASSLAEPLDLVISSENFYLLTDPARVLDTLRISGAVPHRTITVVVYLRRQDEAHESWYNQTVKAQGYDGTLQDCVRDNDGLWDYPLVVDAWAAVFGPTNIIVRPYQPQDLRDGDIRRDFVDLLGLNDDRFEYPAERVNTRLTRPLLEFQRIINSLPLTPIEKRRFHKDLMELAAQRSMAAGSHEAPLLTFEERDAILQRYRSGNAATARQYLGRNALFDEALPDSTLGAHAPESLDLEEAVRIFGWLLCRTGDRT